MAPRGRSAIASNRKTPELLAPAGDWDALRAAVANGADAVYFGLEEFNARRRATNFTLETLPEVIGYLHGHNVRGYVAFNTLIFSDELPRAAAYVAAIAEAGADAVIVQDLGLVRLIGRIAPTLPIHASTQMTQTESRGIAYLSSLGVRRVILARELSLADIAAIARETRVELEVFVHGALCISYSGQCLASESLFGRSANRGECAQACRLPYTPVVDGTAVAASGADAKPLYVLSPHDLAVHARVGELLGLGVTGFKIEGRLKSACYVAAATQVYRAAIDAAIAGRPFAPSRQQELDLAQGFSRGFTQGSLVGVDHQELVDGRSPKSRGVRIGTVAARTSQGIVIDVDPSMMQADPAAAPLKPGDGVVFDEGRPDRDEQGGRVYSVEPTGGRGRVAGHTELTFGRDDVDLDAVPIGCTVWKTDDPALRRRMEASFSRDRVVRRVPITARVRAAAGETLGITLSDDASHEVHVTSAQPVQAARKHPLTAEVLREQLGRMGDTPFELASVELVGPGDAGDVPPVMVPKSVLNELRRQAVQTLLEYRTAAARHAVVEPDALDAIRRETASGRSVGMSEEPPRLYVLVRSDEQLDAAIEWAGSSPPDPVAMIYCDFADVHRYGGAVTRAHAAGIRVGLATPRILKPGEKPLLQRIAESGADAALVRNLGGLGFLQEYAPQLALIADYSFNGTNEITVAMLAERGVTRMVPSYDLDGRQLSELLRLAPAGLFEVVLHQRVPMFHTQHCLFAARLSAGTDCDTCGHPCERHELALRDRVGVDHPVLTDAAGRNTVFNGSVQPAPISVSELIARGVRHFRVELLRETPAQTHATLGGLTRTLSEAAER